MGFSTQGATEVRAPALAPRLAEASPARLFEECLKLFLSGYAEQSLLGLERFGLLAVLFPESAAALKSNRRGAARRVVIEGLRGTEARVRGDEPVSLAMQLALVRGPGDCRGLMELKGQGMKGGGERMGRGRGGR